MAYQYTITECGYYLRVEVNGSRDRSDVTTESLRMWQDVASECKEKHINLILAVFRLSGIRSLMDTFNIVEGVQHWLWPELAIAYIDTDPLNQKENIIAEQSAMMHGINFRAFLSEKDGLQWLKAMHSSQRH
ncbi:hypothetical protein [Amphritea pacifica]|uniref:STAS/SEC14 domain-containing protein n=1 Tax=Amphritea pacifica TaxID=2811233 RepID=A0ABS2W777_9GAMM|nr:hypothetical protein [Amphritea pacifica]MBN0987559.1 hypothetical protein [Amphritea pacifica]MBN1005118.1 hypothetical protein [Amphritea pacifica]